MLDYVKKLEAKLAGANDRKTALSAMLELGWYLREIDPKRSVELASQSYELATHVGDVAQMALAHRNLGYSYILRCDHKRAIQHLRTSLKISATLRDRAMEGMVHVLLTYLFVDSGDFEEAVTSAYKAKEIFEQVSDEEGLAWADFATALLNFELGNYDIALSLFERSEVRFVECHQLVGEARALCGIGRVYNRRGSYGRALDYYSRSQAIHKETGCELGMAETTRYLGDQYRQLENYELSLQHLYDAIRVFDELSYTFGTIACQLIIVEVFLEQGLADECIVILYQALDLAEHMHAKPLKGRAHKLLAEAFALQNNYEQAYEHHAMYFDLQEQVFSDEARAKLRNQEIRFATEQAKTEAELHQIKNIELASSYAELEKALGTMQDSITYASRIQNAMLPNREQLKALLPESFIYFQPRDVVSGDFYWLAEKNDNIILAAVDCTGHGVPGAFMSVLGQSLLNQVVKENYIFTPAQILKKVDELLVDVLSQTDEQDEIFDGMEAAIITINLDDQTLQYAGANIPLYIMNKNGLNTLQSTRTALGGTQRRNEEKEFMNHKRLISPGDTVYMFSDGFRDQFGREEADGDMHKYSTRRFQRLLQEIYPLPMAEQKVKLAEEFASWKGKLKQLDDVMVVGVHFA